MKIGEECEEKWNLMKESSLTLKYEISKEFPDNSNRIKVISLFNIKKMENNNNIADMIRNNNKGKGNKRENFFSLKENEF